MDELDFEYHLTHYTQLFGHGNKQNAEYARNRAIETQNLHVHDALRDEQLKWVQWASTLTDPEAKHFALYGAGRRSGLLWTAYREILGTIVIDRTAPLSSDETKAVSRDLNTLYINIAGTLDNGAWCLRHERGSQAIKTLADSQVGLFSKKFIGDPAFSALRVALEPYRPWFVELRKRRDPAAHRIPLSVPPAVLTPDDARRYAALQERINETIAAGDYDLAGTLEKTQAALGQFLPKFLHHPREPLIPFYPTTSQDLTQLTRVSQLVRDFLRP
jgi:hypothetical protein